MNIGNITSDNFNLDGNGKDIQIEVYEQLIEQLQQENKQLKEQLLATQTNEETFRLEMEDITKILGLDEDTIFDDVKTYARSLKENKILRENAEHNDKVVDKKVSFDGNTASFNTSYFCNNILPKQIIFEHLEHNNTGVNFVSSRMGGK